MEGGGSRATPTCSPRSPRRPKSCARKITIVCSGAWTGDGGPAGRVHRVDRKADRDLVVNLPGRNAAERDDLVTRARFLAERDRARGVDALERRPPMAARQG